MNTEKQEVSIINAIHIYMEESGYVAHLLKTAPEKVNPIFIFARLTDDRLEIGASTIRTRVHMPNFNTILIRSKAGLETPSAARAYQMGLCHGIRSQDIPVITGPMFDEVGGEIFETSPFSDELEMIYTAEIISPDIGEEHTNEEELEDE